MEKNSKEQQEVVNEIYNYAAKLLVEDKKTPKAVEAILVKQGLDTKSAQVVVAYLENEISRAKKDAAQKDMLWGALWAIGGTIATIADIGYIFWGAIVFGLLQFGKGVVNVS
jgi:exopolyphosphatase/pppGpp-phosphohydrolase